MWAEVLPVREESNVAGGDRARRGRGMGKDRSGRLHGEGELGHRIEGGGATQALWNGVPGRTDSEAVHGSSGMLEGLPGGPCGRARDQSQRVNGRDLRGP